MCMSFHLNCDSTIYFATKVPNKKASLATRLTSKTASTSKHYSNEHIVRTCPVHRPSTDI